MVEWIDMHVHLDKLEEGPEKAIQMAKDVGVTRMITIGTEPKDLPVVLKLAHQNPHHVFCTLGIHPHEGVLYNEEVGSYIENNLEDSSVVAIGEIGLDYYYDHSSVADQKSALYAQLDMAQKHRMPVEIHTRDAERDTVEILSKYKGNVTGLIHCFTGTEWLARKALDLGYNISISGVVTFKNAEALREVVRFIPIDRLHVETDAPFLAPVPMRGRKNTPSFILHTAQVVANLKKVAVEELAQITRMNACQLFPKLQRGFENSLGAD